MEQERSTKEVGDLGEEIACKFLVERGFSIVGRNYFKKWGEIDVIATKVGKVHFVEVKTVSRVTVGAYRPEDNVHPEKLKRMRRVIQSYLLEKNIEEGDWQFDVLAVILSVRDREARCRYIEDIVL